MNCNIHLQDGGVTKRTFASGDGLDHPNDGAMVDVQFKGTIFGDGDKKAFDDRTIKFNVGDGLDVVSWLREIKRIFQGGQSALLR